MKTASHAGHASTSARLEPSPRASIIQSTLKCARNAAHAPAYARQRLYTLPSNRTGKNKETKGGHATTTCPPFVLLGADKGETVSRLPGILRNTVPLADGEYKKKRRAHEWMRLTFFISAYHSLLFYRQYLLGRLVFGLHLKQFLRIQLRVREVIVLDIMNGEIVVTCAEVLYLRR